MIVRKRSYNLAIMIVMTASLLLGCSSASISQNLQNECEAIYNSLVETQLVPSNHTPLGIQDVSKSSKYNKFNDVSDEYGPGKDYVCFYDNNDNNDNIRTNLYVRLNPSLSDMKLGSDSSYTSNDLFLLRADTYEFPRDRGNKSVWCLGGCPN